MLLANLVVAVVVVAVADGRPLSDDDGVWMREKEGVGEAVLPALGPLDLKGLLPVCRHRPRPKILPRRGSAVPRRGPTAAARFVAEIRAGQFLGKGVGSQEVRREVLRPAGVEKLFRVDNDRGGGGT